LRIYNGLGRSAAANMVRRDEPRPPAVGIGTAKNGTECARPSALQQCVERRFWLT